MSFLFFVTFYASSVCILCVSGPSRRPKRLGARKWRNLVFREGNDQAKGGLPWSPVSPDTGCGRMIALQEFKKREGSVAQHGRPCHLTWAVSVCLGIKKGIGKSVVQHGHLCQLRRVVLSQSLILFALLFFYQALSWKGVLGISNQCQWIFTI